MLRVVLGFVLLVAVCGGVVATTDVVSLDGDSRPALTELQAGTDPLAADTDGDGLDDDAEHDAGTDPTEADSDSDGIGDAAEVDGPTDPTTADSDDDGLEDGPEVDEYGTDPVTADSDADGLEDGEEVNEYGTDPTIADTDDDGLDDGEEVETYGSDPTAPDTDDDGLQDGREVRVGADPTVVDTDGDGLDDHAEVVEYDTEPNAADTDSDDLADEAEVEEYGTDPRDRDTDGDGLPDGAEVHNQALADADPLQKDVFVEVDYMSGERPSDQAIDAVVQQFADAPVENPDGSTGIDLHVNVDDATDSAAQTSMSDLDAIMVEHFDHVNQGYFYAVAVEKPIKGDEAYGGISNGARDNGQFMFQTDWASGREYPDNYVSSLFMHELGHSLGISSRDYRGIDSNTVSHTEYQSTMNYDAPDGYVGYSDSEPFDGWEHIVETGWAPPVGETL